MSVWGAYNGVTAVCTYGPGDVDLQGYGAEKSYVVHFVLHSCRRTVLDNLYKRFLIKTEYIICSIKNVLMLSLLQFLLFKIAENNCDKNKILCSIYSLHRNVENAIQQLMGK